MKRNRFLLIMFVVMSFFVMKVAPSNAALTCTNLGETCACDGQLPASAACNSYDMAGASGKVVLSGFSEVGGAVGVPGPVPATGQTLCYDAAGTQLATCSGTGQDGDKLAGVTWPTSRFVANSDTTITDKLTGLIWTQSAYAPGPAVCSPGMNKTWQEALDYVKCLNTNKYLTYSDWRLPTINDLESLVTQGTTNSATWLKNANFTSIQPVDYWTSTSMANYLSFAWAIKLTTNTIEGGDKTYSTFAVWPVRGGLPIAGQLLPLAPVALTGQTTCSDSDGLSKNCTGTGQDGDTFSGAVGPSPRLSVSLDTTVFDSLTNLYWAGNGNAPGPVACTPGVTKSWQGALDYVACLNANKYRGYNDWRLPNFKELRTLINYGQISNSAWLNSMAFVNIQAGPYWSSTTANPTKNARFIDLDTGEVTTAGKTTQNYVIPVRGGQSTASTTAVVFASNMYPYTSDYLAEMPFYNDLATGYVNDAITFKATKLDLLGVTRPSGTTIPANATPLEQLLFDPSKNYATVIPPLASVSNGVCSIAADPQLESKLLTARNVFAMEAQSLLNSADRDTALANMNNTVRTLVTIYVMFADQFMVNAIDFRFPSFTDSSKSSDDRLKDQIDLLNNAQLCYTKAINVMIDSLARPAVGDFSIADMFDQNTYSLFNVVVEKLTTTLGERSARELVLNALPATITMNRTNAMASLRDISTNSFLMNATLAQRKVQGANVSSTDRITVALSKLRKQGSVFLGNMNPFGFDERYVPMLPFDKLLALAKEYQTQAVTAEAALQQDKRDYDSLTDKYKLSVAGLIDGGAGSLKNQIFSMTSIPTSLDDFSFLQQAVQSGQDLLTCSLDLSEHDFNTCIDAPNMTQGRLKLKYMEIRDKYLLYQKASQDYNDIGSTIHDRYLLDQTMNGIYQIKYQGNVATLQEYQDAMSQSIQSEWTKKQNDLWSQLKKWTLCAVSVAGSVGVNIIPGVGQAISAPLASAAVAGVCAADSANQIAQMDDEFKFKLDRLKLETNKEIGLQTVQKNFEIAANNAQAQYDIQQLLYKQTEALIGVGLARHQMRMASQDFLDELNEKTNLIFQYAKATQYKTDNQDYLKQNIADARIIRSQLAIRLSDNLRKGSHYAYLAAKALEYRELKPMATVNDVFKIQSTTDLTSFITAIDAYEKNGCYYGGIRPVTTTLSLAQSFLGLTDTNIKAVLGSSATATQISAYRSTQLQSFVSQHLVTDKITNTNMLQFDFVTTVYNVPTLGDGSYNYNVKIWSSQVVSAGCQTLNATNYPHGVFVYMTFKGSTLGGLTDPYVTLEQKGHSTFLNVNQQVVEYIPVNKFFNIDYDMTVSGTNSDLLNPNNMNNPAFDPIVTRAAFTSYTDFNTTNKVLNPTSEFDNRSIASSQWTLTIANNSSNPKAALIDWSVVDDVIISLQGISYK